MNQPSRLVNIEIKAITKSLDFLDELEKRAKTPALRGAVEGHKAQLFAELVKRGVSTIGQVEG